MSAAAKRTALAAATVLALFAFSVVGPAGGAQQGGERDRVPPSTPGNPHVTGATESLVYVVWDPAQDDVGVAGYYVYGDTGKATVASPAYVVSSLGCGESSAISLVAFDDAGNRSPKVTATVATAACPDTQPPTAPSGFRQAATTQSDVVLAWNPSADNVGVVGYGVYRNMSRIVTTAEPTVTLSGLGCGNTYGYSIDATDAAGNRSELASAYVQTAACSDGSRPTAPSNLTVTGHTSSSLSLSWSASSDNVGVAGYRISLDGAPTTTVKQTSVTVSGLVCGRSYSVGVDAFDVAGNRSAVIAVSAVTDACPPPPPTSDTTPPSTPAGFVASNITQTGVNLAWSASTDNVGVAGYDVYRNSSKVASASSTSASLSGLSCGTTYGLGVSAVDAAGNASPLAQITAATAACSAPPPPSDTTAPSQPGNFRIAATTRSSISLAWDASTDNVGVSGYRTYLNGAAAAATTQTSATVSSLACGTTYTFEVDAYDASGNRSGKASLNGSTAACADTQAPSGPTNVVATSRTATSIALSWSASTDNVGVSGYGLYRGGTSVGTSSTTSGIFAGLTCNTNYTLAVDAYDAAGNRSYQTVVMVSTTVCPDSAAPSTPTGLAASSITQTGLTVSWNASTDNVGVTGYDVYRYGTKMETVSSTSSNQAGLACGAPYTFGVVARDAAGNTSGQAQLAAFTVTCSPPVTSGTAIDSLSDLSGAFEPQGTFPATSNPHFHEIATPYGPGFDVIADTNDVTPWDATMKSILGVQAQSNWLDRTDHWSGSILFPSSGNPDGFPKEWSSGAFWEFHTETDSGLHLGIDAGFNSPGNHFRVGFLNPDRTYSWYYSAATVPMDQWIPFSIDVKWSYGSDGFTRVAIGGETIVNRSGPSLPSGQSPKLQFGYYGVRQLRNEILFGGLQRS